MAIGESERLSCIEGARSAFERTATGLVAVLLCAAAGRRRMLRQQHRTAVRRKNSRRGRRKKPQGEKNSRRGRQKKPRSGKGFNWIREKVLLGCADSRFAEPRIVSKGFNLVCTNVLSLCADLRFARPRSSLKKVLIVVVRSCGCGALIRGLQNLGASCEGERVVTFCIVQKVTKKHAGLRPATSIQSSAGSDFAETSGGSCRNRFCLQNGGEKALNRCERVAVLLTQD